MSAAVSIIVPCYNVAPYLDKCMESLTLQTLGDLEIISVNDGSGDDTPAILRAWAERDGRIRVVDRENGGLSAARNTGMALAGGEYIGFVDPDDYVEHSMYGRLLEKARRSDADVTACGYTGFSDRDGSILEKWSLSPEEGVEENVQACVFQENAVWRRMAAVAWNKLYKREFLERNGLRFEPRFRQGEDDAFWLMVLAHATRLAVIPDQLYWYRRQRKGAISLAWEEKGCPLPLVADRLLHATAYWKKCGWLESGLERGWVLHALWYYLLVHLVPAHKPLPRLTAGEWAQLHGQFREWFSLVEGTERLQGLDKWETAFCRLLEAQERPLLLVAERLLHATEYWKKCGWLESAVRQGWLAHIMKRYLLAHVTSAEEIFRRLDEEERRGLAARYRKWLKGVEIGPGFAGLNKWDRAFCRLLGAEPVKLGPCARLHSTLMSACSGRKGRYHRLKLLLSGLS